MKKTTRFVLFLVFAVAFQALAFLNWYGGCRAWESLEYSPKESEILLRIICMIVWIDVGIVAGVLALRWYYIFLPISISLLESLLSPAGFTFLKEYPFEQILQKGYLFYHIISSFSGLIVCSVMIVMLVVRLCILDRCQQVSSVNADQDWV